jgi:hypothetical protein
MKRKFVIVLVILVALVFGTGGYILGITQNSNFMVGDIGEQESIEDYKDAYKKGWSFWFSDYGMNGEGMQYIIYYQYGRKYNTEFTSTLDAFTSGYKDGFYYVNQNEPSELFIKKMEKGYKEYYPN